MDNGITEICDVPDDVANQKRHVSIFFSLSFAHFHTHITHFPSSPPPFLCPRFARTHVVCISFYFLYMWQMFAETKTKNVLRERMWFPSKKKKIISIAQNENVFAAL